MAAQTIDKPLSFKVQDNLLHTKIGGQWVALGYKAEKATTSKDGLMSKEDKTKLDGLQNYTLAQANDSVLGGIKVGYTPETDTNRAVLLDGSGKAYVSIPAKETIANATAAKEGLMSKEDKAKLDGLSQYILPTAGATLGGIKTGYASSGNNVAVNVDGEGKAFVTMPAAKKQIEVLSETEYEGKRTGSTLDNEVIYFING